VNSDDRFQIVDRSEKLTKRAAHPLNLRPQAGRLEVKGTFISNRIDEDWNILPSEVKNARTVQVAISKMAMQNTELGWNKE
jgi:hypothetical protein